jgi:hypothetical protein
MALGVTLWAALLTPFLLRLSCSEDFESHYDSFQQAHQADAGHGWLPEFLPTTATDIREIHNIDSNQVWGSFFNRDARSLSSFCSDPISVSTIRIASPGVRWWPKELVGDTESSSQATLYRCSGSPQSTLIALAHDGRFYWVSNP